MKKSVVFFFLAFLCVENSYAQLPATGLSFDGTNDYINVPVNPSLNISATITLEAWIYPTSAVGTQDVICKSSNAENNSYIFPRTQDGWDNLQFRLYINGQGWKILSVPYGGDKINQWHHLAATYDGYYMRIFIDGNEAGKLGVTGSITVNNNPLFISGHKGYANEYFAGKVDEVRIWNRALSQCEIASTMSCELALPQNGLAAYYKLNTGVIDVAGAGLNLGLTNAIDETLNHNNGTLTNFGLLGTVSNWTDGKATGTCSVFAPVNATASSLQATLPVGSPINLIGGGGGAGAIYSWTGPNGYSTNVQNPIIPNAGLLQSGTYTLVVTDNGCSASASTIVTVASSGKALNFDGSDNVVTIPNGPSFNTTSAISLETWVNPAKRTPTSQSVLSKSNRVESTGFIFPRTDDGWLSFSFWLAIDGNWKVLSASYPAINQWNHVAATYDGFVMRIYLNGALVNSLTAPGTITTNSNDLTIGRQEGYTEYFKGGVDEMRIWNRALTQCEIQNNLTCELNGANNGLASQTGLNAYYRFNQGLANVNNSGLITLVDSSGKANNGTLQGFDLNSTSSNWIDGSAVNNAVCSNFTQTLPTASSNGPVFEVGSTIQLTASSGTTYAWIGPSGFTSSLQNPVVANAGITNSGIYTVAVTGNGCTSSASTYVQVTFKAGTLDFDGVDDQVTVPVKPSLNISNTITLEAWLYPTNNTRVEQDVMCKSTRDVNNGYIFPRTDDAWGSYIFYLHLNGAWQKLSAPYPGINQWHHVAATYDGYFMRIYLDGKLSASKEIEGTITQNTNDLILGQQPGFNEYFQGKVEEARVWNRALNQCEIVNYMQCEPDPLIMTGLVAYYRFDQGFLNANNSTITTLTDVSNNGNHGSLQNFALNGLTSNWSDFKIGGPCAIYSAPPVTASSNGTVFGIGTTIQLFGTGGNTYIWEGPNGFASGSQNPTITNAQVPASGTYTLTAPFVKCEVKTSTRLIVTSLLPIEASGPTTFCPSGSVTLKSPNTGSVYQWYLNDVAIAGAASQSFVATQAGTYTVKVTSATGAVLVTLPTTVIVTDNLAPVPDVVVLPILNILSPGTISTFPTATDNCRGTITGTTLNPTTYVENQRGTFTITWDYNDQNGNISHQTQQVIVTRAPDITPPVLTVPADISVSPVLSLCGAMVSFTATATDNSLDPVTITYSKNPGTLFTIGTTVVTVTATDVSGNAVNKTFNVTVLPTVVAPITGNTTICAGSTTALTTASTSGTWSSSNITIATVNASGIVSGVSAGTATISYTNGCGVSASALVTVNSVPSIPSVSVIDKCGSSILSTTATGSLVWSTTATTSSITVLTSGTYTVTQTINGCTSAAGSGTAAPLVIPATPVVSVLDNCGSSTLSTTAAGTLVWNTTPVSISTSINVTVAGTYSVTQTLNGCTSSAGSGIAAPKAIQPVPAITVVNNCGSSTLSTNATGTFIWSNGVTGSSITVTTSGNYSVTATNTSGCSATSAISAVTINTIPSVLPITGATPVNVSGTLQLLDATTGGVWSSSNISVASVNASGLVTGIAAGTASINYTVTNGICSTIVTTSITVNPNCVLPILSPIADLTENAVNLCSAAVSYTISVTGTPAPIISYAFTGATSFSGTGTGSASQFNKGITSVTIKASNACGTVMTSFTITVKDITPPVLSVPSDKTVACGGSTAPSATGTATGTDNCGTVNISYADVAGTNSIKRTWTATDASGNSSSALQTITLTGPFVSTITSTPTNNAYTGAPSTSLFLGYGAQSTTLQVVTPASGTPYAYAWSGTGVSMLSTNNTGTRVFTPTKAGSYLFTVITTNNSGCQSTATVTICVTDIRAGVFDKTDDDKKESDKKDSDKKESDKKDSDKKDDDNKTDDKNSENTKVYLCHVPNGNTGKTITLSISINAVAAHLANHPGDRLGSCDQAPCGVAIVKNATTAIIETVTKEITKAATEEELKVTVMPNPSTTYFTLKFESRYLTPVTLRVMDANGRIIDAKSQIGSNSTLQIGHSYISGTYYAEMIQGTQRKVIQLIKARG